MQPSDHRDAPSGSRACRVTRRRAGEARDTVDRVVDETPVALVFNGIAHSVMMATPIDLDAFGLGFALSEGIVERASDVFDIESECRPGSAEVRLTVSQQAFMTMKAHRRALAGRTGCGVCGIESIAQLDLHPPRIASAGAAAGIGTDAVARAARALPARQPLMHATGGIHAAAWCDRDGAVLEVFEDVGRHNALDKLIGRLARRRADLAAGFVFLSSRASYELVRKAARVGMPMIATISAPTSLAIDVAREAGVRLLGFCRNDGVVEYVSPDPLPLPEPTHAQPHALTAR
ncbi:formate dehydrogenase accessory protein FdhD [Burkholderia territorii]|uniref:Sulfur carrier protein FdhD n=1 Tax=Burkholderia territorii TaxID=1503055 RepID=A0A106E747_9BURK|nr:formate dehydrogenase accessory sulfurtransferase FdhD [Burkholderia territorii]KVV38992.1 formate dehydrogenase accessory protein FdhD [Burkholderia territorii]KVX42228.1 formate dehydrogenase accessory protein FdhD [Burkholderia territorii]